jgi:predicted ATPase/DNA-binding winged helix-turn-helix (wHTH) protein
MSLTRPTEPVIAFGRYRLSQNPPRLTADGLPVEISARALELLFALVEAEGRPVTLAELGQRAWPRVSVEANTVQAQVSTLRRALGNDRDLVATVPGYGYRFAGRARLLDAEDEEAGAHGTAPAGMLSCAAALPEPPALRLPVHLTSFIGRHAELSELLGLLSVGRVVTLTGAPGLGKTRLAHEAARRLAAHVPDGVVAIALPPHLHADSLIEACALALRIAPEYGIDVVERLIDAIGTRRMLLIVDCSEPLRESAGHLLNMLIAGAPGLRVIVTGTAPLLIASEHLVALGSLRIPDHVKVGAHEAREYDALRLLFARLSQLLAGQEQRVARPRTPPAMRPLADFDTGRLTPNTLAMAALIARRLDGVPLALELAAAAIDRRTRTAMSLDAALFAFARDLDDLMARGAGTPNQPRSRLAPVAAVLQLHTAGLPEATRALLWNLGVFSGEFTRCSAVRMFAELAPRQEGGDAKAAHTDLGFESSLDDLLDAGLVEQIDGDGVSTLRLPHAVQLYAREMLVQSSAWDHTACALALSLAPRLAARRPPGDRRPGNVLDRIDIDDLRAALDWSLRNDRFETAIALIEGSLALWRALSLAREYLRTIRAALNRVELSTPRRIRDDMRLRVALAHALPLTHAPLDEVTHAWQEAYELANACADNTYRQHALIGLIVCSVRAGELERAMDLQASYDRIAQASWKASQRAGET